MLFVQILIFATCLSALAAYLGYRRGYARGKQSYLDHLETLALGDLRRADELKRLKDFALRGDQ